jgi:hypothetical protein
MAFTSVGRSLDISIVYDPDIPDLVDIRGTRLNSSKKYTNQTLDRHIARGVLKDGHLQLTIGGSVPQADKARLKSAIIARVMQLNRQEPKAPKSQRNHSSGGGSAAIVPQTAASASVGGKKRVYQRKFFFVRFPQMHRSPHFDHSRETRCRY